MMGAIIKIFFGDSALKKQGINALQYALLHTFIPFEQRAYVYQKNFNKEKEGDIWLYMMGKKSNWGALNPVKRVIIPVRSFFRLIDLALQLINAGIQRPYWLLIDNLEKKNGAYWYSKEKKDNQDFVDRAKAFGENIGLNIISGVVIVPLVTVALLVTRPLAAISHAFFAPVDTFKKLRNFIFPDKNKKMLAESQFDDKYKNDDSCCDYWVDPREDDSLSTTASLCEELGGSFSDTNFDDDKDGQSQQSVDVNRVMPARLTSFDSKEQIKNQENVEIIYRR